MRLVQRINNQLIVVHQLNFKWFIRAAEWKYYFYSSKRFHYKIVCVWPVHCAGVFPHTTYMLREPVLINNDIQCDWAIFCIAYPFDKLKKKVLYQYIYVQLIVIRIKHNYELIINGVEKKHLEILCLEKRKKCLAFIINISFQGVCAPRSLKY